MARRKTDEEYRQELKDAGIGVVPLEPYKGAKTSILHRCICGNEWKSQPSNILMGKKCGCDSPFQTKWTHEEYLQALKDKDIKIKPLEKYINAQTPIKHLCICGSVWSIRPDTVLRNKDITCGCRLKAVMRKMKIKSHEDYLQELKDKNIDVIPLEKYQQGKIKIKHRCICGSVWKVAPEKVLDHRLCGCVKSKGELIIKQELQSKKYEFEQQKIFKELRDLKSKRPLKYDFAIFQKGQLKALIEFQGMQHFYFSKHWHRTKEYFFVCKQRDQMKKVFAKKKGIPLIELTYKQQDNLIQALEIELKALGISKPTKRKYEQLALF